MKKTVKILAALLAVAFVIIIGRSQTNPAYSPLSSFIATFGFAPVAQTNGTLVTPTVSGTLTNTTTLIRVANPLTSGSLYTNPAYVPGLLTLTVLCTNNANGALSNATTTQYWPLGSVTGVGTNYQTQTIRVGPSEVVVLTNVTAVLNLISSEWRN